MSEDILGSNLPADNARGQNGDTSPSSTYAKTLQPIADVAPPNASANAGDWQTRPVSSAQAVPTHPGAKGRAPKSGETVPANSRPVTK